MIVFVAVDGKRLGLRVLTIVPSESDAITDDVSEHVHAARMLRKKRRVLDPKFHFVDRLFLMKRRLLLVETLKGLDIVRCTGWTRGRRRRRQQNMAGGFRLATQHLQLNSASGIRST